MENNSNRNNNGSNNKRQHTRKWCSNCRMNNHKTNKCTADKSKKKDSSKSNMYMQEQVTAMINLLKVLKDSKKKKRKVRYELVSSFDNKPSSHFTQHSKPKLKNSS